MKKLVINGGKPLKGEVTISGAKNSTVALIPAAIIANEPVVLEGVPEIQDVDALIEILNDFNVKTEFVDGTLTIDPREMKSIPMPKGKIQSMRASYYFMGATLAKLGEGVVGLPGGCFLGPRPIDQHLKGFKALGADVRDHDGAIYLSTGEEGLVGTKIYMDVVSVGATINVLLASVRAKGKTIIENAAREPEIIDVVNLLNKMGANIKGAGTSIIRVEGVESLHGCTHTIIPDRIEAGTYLSIAAAVGEGVRVKNVIFEHLESLIAKMNEMGVKMEVGEDDIYVFPTNELKAVNIKTMPYPGFATDLQQTITPLFSKATGTAMVVDTIYPKRVGHVPELNRMGARGKVIEDIITFEGPTPLVGAEVAASDLRAGAGLVVAGLMAEGTTKISNIGHILRGYSNIVEKLQALGADITMIEE